MTAIAALVLGVDPGAATCGIILRCGDQLIRHNTITRPKTASRAEWVDQCLAALLEIVDPLHGPDLICVEDVTTPSPHLRQKMIDPTPIIETAAVAGAVAGWAWCDWAPVEWVPPGGNGSGPLAAYPTELRPTRGRGAGKDSLRHMRSAWDVAGRGLQLHRGRRVA